MCPVLCLTPTGWRDMLNGEPWFCVWNELLLIENKKGRRGAGEWRGWGEHELSSLSLHGRISCVWCSAWDYSSVTASPHFCYKAVFLQTHQCVCVCMHAHECFWVCTHDWAQGGLCGFIFIFIKSEDSRSNHTNAHCSNGSNYQTYQFLLELYLDLSTNLHAWGLWLSRMIGIQCNCQTILRVPHWDRSCRSNVLPHPVTCILTIHTKKESRQNNPPSCRYPKLEC